MAIGKVYIYNLFNESADVSFNGGDVGTIAGWNEANGYAPANIAAASAEHATDNTGKVYRGGTGANSVKVTWPSGVAEGTITFPTIAENVSIEADLVCYIAKNQAFVETVAGFVQGGNQTLTFTGPQ